MARPAAPTSTRARPGRPAWPGRPTAWRTSVSQGAAQAEAVEDRLGLPALARRPSATVPAGSGHVLVEHDDRGAPAPPDRARLGLDVAGQDPQQRRLAGAVEPDDGQPVAARHGHRQSVNSGSPGPADGQRRRRRARITGASSQTVHDRRQARRYRRGVARDGILSGPIDLDGPRPSRPAHRTVEAAPRSGRGAAGQRSWSVRSVLRRPDRRAQRPRGSTEPLAGSIPGGFHRRWRGRHARRPPAPAASATAGRTASGSVAVPAARPGWPGPAGSWSRASTTPSWSRRCGATTCATTGVVVERLDGVDDLADVVRDFGPGPGSPARRPARPPGRRVEGDPRRPTRSTTRRARHRPPLRRRVGRRSAVGRRHRAPGPTSPRARRGRRACSTPSASTSRPGRFWRQLLGPGADLADLDRPSSAPSSS